MGVRRKKIGFIYTGGGSKGAVQVGMTKALLEFGVTPTLIAGSSVGALNATMTAFYPTPKGNEKLVKIWEEIQEESIFPSSKINIIQGLVNNEYLFENKGVKKMIGNIPSNKFTDTKVPLYINTTLLSNGNSFIHDKGSLKDILLATTAIPGIFPPIDLEGELHVDGGISMMAPLYFPQADKLDAIYILDASGEHLKGKNKRALDMLRKGFAHSIAAQVKIAARDRRVKVISVDNSIYDVDNRDFSNTAKYIKAGHDRAVEVLNGE